MTTWADVTAFIKQMGHEDRLSLMEWVQHKFCAHCGKDLPKYAQPKTCPCVVEWAAVKAEAEELFSDTPRVNAKHPAFQLAKTGTGIAPMVEVVIEEPDAS